MQRLQVGGKAKIIMETIENKLARHAKRVNLIQARKAERIAKKALLPKASPTKAQLKNVEAAKRASEIKKARHAKHRGNIA